MNSLAHLIQTALQLKVCSAEVFREGTVNWVVPGGYIFIIWKAWAFWKGKKEKVLAACSVLAIFWQSVGRGGFLNAMLDRE